MGSGGETTSQRKSTVDPQEQEIPAESVDEYLGKDLHSKHGEDRRTQNGERIIVTEEEGPIKKKKKTASYFNVVFSGFALLSDGYQSGVISFINLLMTEIYGTEIFNSEMSSRLSYALFVGAIIGQLGFGLIIDRVGRKIGLILTTALVILGAAMSAASSGTSPTGLLWMMVVSRGVLGVGVGGEYPCSSVKQDILLFLFWTLLTIHQLYT